MVSDYSRNDIKPLSLAEVVRKRPGMYFGDVEYDAAKNAISEVLANAVDLFLAGLCDLISLKVENGRIVVRDNGPGLPFHKRAPEDEKLSLVEYYLTHLHHTPTADNHVPHIHVFAGSLGLAVLNAGCTKLLIESSDGHHFWKQEFGRGKIITEASCVTGQYAKGTQLEIVLDPEIFGNPPLNSLNMPELRKTMFELAHFFPGLTVELESERFFSKNGLLDLAVIFYKRPPAFRQPPRQFFFAGQQEEVQIQVAAMGKADADSATEYNAWVNGTESVAGGTHVKGLHNAFVTAQWQPKVALIHVIMHNPQFANPCKDKLSSPHVIRVIEALLEEPLRLFIEQNK